MDLKALYSPLLKWWWLILLSAVLAASSSFLIVRNQPPVYNTSTTLIIGRTIADPNPSSNEIYLDQQLGNLYTNYASAEPVKNSVMKALGLTWLPQYSVRAMANTQFIQIIVTDSDPVRALRVNNELANQLIKLSPSGSQADANGQQSFINSQLAQTQKNIVDTTNQITQKQNDLGTLSSAHEIAQTQQDIQALQSKLALLQTNYANLLTNTQSGATNTLSVLEPATLPSVPVGPGKPIIVLLATVISIALAVGTSFLIEFLDGSFKSPEEVEQLIGVPIVGYLSRVKPNDLKQQPMVLKQPYSVMAEAYRMLRASMMAGKWQKLNKVIMVTSPEAGDGKTTVAVNLAASFALEEKKVILVDGDFRNPEVHQTLGIVNKIGLGEVLSGKVDLRDALMRWENTNLLILTAGNQGEMLDELFQPARIQKLLSELEGMANIVIFDSPPFFISDAMTLTPYMDGMLIVIKPEHTRRKITRVMLERIKQARGTIIGVVMNAIPVGLSGYASYYKPYSPFYYSKYSESSGHHKEKAGILK
jgi:non-specific protein-tyrosine kinase